MAFCALGWWILNKLNPNRLSLITISEDPTGTDFARQHVDTAAYFTGGHLHQAKLNFLSRPLISIMEKKLLLLGAVGHNPE